MIAAFVSSRNTCYFCQTSHGAAASHLNGGNSELVESVCREYKTAAISEKLKALLAIAEQVQIDGKRVTTQLVDEARQHGATDLDIHDTVLIAAAFSMYITLLRGCQVYAAMGKRMAEGGYCSPFRTGVSGDVM